MRLTLVAASAGALITLHALAGGSLPLLDSASTHAQQRLGQRLFADVGLSANHKVSCASCHRLESHFADQRVLAEGVEGRTGTRNTPSLLDVDQQRNLFWDGRRSSLESQATDPLFNSAEHGLAGEAELLSILRKHPDYPRTFAEAFGGEPVSAITMPRVAQALAAFQRTLVSGPTPFDRFLAGDANAIKPEARRGWELFSGQAQCTRCHAVEGPRPLLTDHGFHSLGVGLDRVQRQLPELTQRLAAQRANGKPLDHQVLADPDMAELGRFVVTLDPADIGAFKTPVLRNVALTAPYMHDGSVPTLHEAVDREIYYRGQQAGRPLILTPAERDDLVAFLQSLTSDPVVSPAAHRTANP